MFFSSARDLNTALTRVDYAIAGWLTKPLTGNATLTTVNDGDDEARAAMIKFTGVLAADAVVTVPTVSKSYFVWNATNRVLTFSAGGAPVVQVDAGDRTVIACDGAGVHTINFGGLGLKEFIAASAMAATGSLPATTGNAGKFLFTDGSSSFWRQPQTTDLGDYLTNIIGKQIALAVAL